MSISDPLVVPRSKSLLDTATEIFSSYARLAEGELPQDPISNLQVRLSRWGTQFSGIDGEVACVLGQGEEIGELVEAVAGKLEDPGSFSMEGSGDKWYENASKGQVGALEHIFDAIGDILIYSCQLASNLQLDFSTILREGEGLKQKAAKNTSEDLAELGWALLGLTAATGRIQHATLKNKQKLRGYDNELKYKTEVLDGMVQIARFCTQISEQLNEKVFTVFFQVSERVMRRDWKKNSLTGGEGTPEVNPVSGG